MTTDDGTTGFSVLFGVLLMHPPPAPIQWVESESIDPSAAREREG